MSSFIVQPYRRKYLKEYYKRMSQDNLTMLWDDNVASILQEQGFSIEQAPRSVYKVEKLYEALNKYAPTSLPYINLDDEHIKEGLKFAYACFARNGRDKLQALDFTPEVIYSITSNLKGSAGLTAWGQTKAESYMRAYERGSQTLLEEKQPEPCIAFKRTQFNDKTRLVWGYPYSMTAIEGLVARPLIKNFLKANTPMSFGISSLKLGTKLRVASYSNRWAYATDFSSFDSSISAKLIHLAFNILKTWFNLDELVSVGNKEVTVSRIFKLIEYYFINTMIVMPDGNLYKGKRHGVPSGSYFTQMVDSVVNAIVIGAMSSKFKMHVCKDTFNVLGDDVVFFSNADVDMNRIASYVKRFFGLTINVAKSGKYKSGEEIVYLGRHWLDGIPDLPQNEILKRMAQPETFRQYSKDPRKRAREVRLLFQSYASVYKSAYHIYMRSFGTNKARYNGMWVELFDSRQVHSSDGFVSNPEHLSGLERYLHKYVYSTKRGFTPVGLRLLA